MRTRWIDSIAEVEPEAWNALTGPLGFYRSHGWLRTIERPDTSYLLVEDGGRLVAGTPLSIAGHGATERTLRAGPRVGNDNRLLTRGAAKEERMALASVLAAALSERAEESGAAAVRFEHLDRDDADLLSDCGAAVAEGRHQAVIHNHEARYETYLAALEPKARKTVRYETRRFTAAGWTVSVDWLSECGDELTPLFAQTSAKHGTPIGEDELARIGRSQVEFMDDRSVVFLCRDEDGVLAGCSLNFVWGDAMYARVAGFDYPRLRDAFEYFNTVYYAPLRYMAEQGLKHLHLGSGTLEAKARRGAQLHPRWIAEFRS